MATQRRPALGYNPYKARMYMSGAVSLGTANAWNVVPFDTVEYDPSGNCTTGASAKYTVPVSGDYLIIGRFSGAGGSGVQSGSAVFKNGAELFRFLDTGAAGLMALGGSDARALVAGDTLDLRYFFSSNAGSTANSGQGQVFLAVRYLGT